MRTRRFLTAIIVLTMVLSLFPAGNVYAADGAHIIINQVYGGAEDGYASHSFIGLYNPTEQAVDLTGWSIQYKSSVEGGASDKWQMLELTGWIGAEDYYLVRCGAVTDTSNVAFNVPEGNEEWDVKIHNKGFSVVLTADTELLGDDFAGDVSGRTDYVDCLAAQGNDATEVQKPVAYETGYSAIQSKKKSVIRSNFADTNDNAADVEEVNYSKAVSDDKAPHRGSYEGKKNQTIILSTANSIELKAGESVLIGAAAQTDLTYTSSNEAVVSVDADGTVTANKAGKAQITITAAENDTYVAAATVLEVLVKQNFTLKTEGFENANAVSLNKLGSYVTGISNPEGGVAEIVSYDKKNNNAWVVNGATGKLDIISLAPVTGKTGTELTAFSIDVKGLTEAKDSTFSYGDMTSVCVNSELGIAAVALQDADYMKDGRVAVLSIEGEFIALINAGCQPDMVTFTPDGTTILTANEGEPRNGGLGDAATDPKGSVTIISLNMEDIAASESVNVTFDTFDAAREQLVAANIILTKDAAPSLDLEPEYIAADNNKAYIALQEANAIAVLDIKTKQYDGIYSLGYKDLSDSRNAADVEDDGEYKADTYQDIVAAYMPDGIALYSTESKTYLLTANEGDAREWGDYKNEDKVKLITASGEETNKVRVIKADVTDGLPEGKNVMFGGRSFSIYEVTSDGLVQVYDSANDFELKTSEYIPSYFNASNDDNDFDSRSQKKGPEPESVTVGRVGERTYAFIALERIGGIMMYDITDVENVTYVNYINSRDFSENPAEAASVSLKSDVAPEGLYFIDAASSPSGTPILLAAFEVSGTVAAYSVGSEPTGDVDKEEPDTDPVETPTEPETESSEASTETETESSEASTEAETIAKEDIVVGSDAVFIDSDGNKVSADKVVFVKQKISSPIEQVINKVNDIIKGAKESVVSYYDIKALIENTDDREAKITSGYVKVKMEYPQGYSRNDEIIVLHVDEMVNVEKKDDFFTFEADGFSPYTIIVIKSEAPEETASEVPAETRPETTSEAQAETQPEISSDRMAETASDSENSVEHYSPGTGAASSVLSVCIVLLILSGISLTALLVKGKKKMIIE